MTTAGTPARGRYRLLRAALALAVVAITLSLIGLLGHQPTVGVIGGIAAGLALIICSVAARATRRPMPPARGD